MDGVKANDSMMNFIVNSVHNEVVQSLLLGLLGEPNEGPLMLLMPLKPETKPDVPHVL